jgi:peptidoglycan/xylan/chitin deacetylase (PgdA/CDA1 family)
MFFHHDLKGHDLPPRALCLTYDDGPGRDTKALGEYLHGERIAATFFVIGRHAKGRAALLRRLRAWGHLIGNHTYSHPGLVAMALAGGDVADEIARTDTLIHDGGVTLFRAPYGNWREKEAPDRDEDRPVSIVANILNRSGLFEHYVGPVNWDINGTDYDFWRRGACAEECAAAYLEKIEHIGRGIVLMHDSSDEEPLRRNNRTLEVTRRIVPVLKERGYRFVRLDQVPQVRAAISAAV